MPPASVTTFLVCWYVLPPKSMVLKLCPISDFQVFCEHISFIMKSVKIRFF